MSNFYKINDINNNKYYQVPKNLYTNPKYKTALNSDAKMLYALLLDRMELSRTNGWTEADGTIFLIYTRVQLADMLGLCQKTVTKACKLLKDVGLIAEKRQGRGLPNLIYIGKLDKEPINESQEHSEKIHSTQEKENLRNKNSKFCAYKKAKNPSFEQQNLQTNNTDKTNINKNYTDSLNNNTGIKNNINLNSS
jgi:biotin operon repressor